MTNAPASDILVSTRDLCRNYPDGNVQALQSVSIEIRRGEYVAIMGPSGSGKSTLLNLLGALDRPDSGEIYFGGQALSAISDLDGFRSMQIGFIFQSFLLMPTLTAAENVQIPMFEGPLPAAARARKARELLEAVKMGHRANHLPSMLSVGERQRVAVARALANDPPVILADEPTGNLDSRTAKEILNEFDRLRQERNLTLIIVTHSDNLAARAGRIIGIRDGQIVDPKELESPMSG